MLGEPKRSANRVAGIVARLRSTIRKVETDSQTATRNGNSSSLKLIGFSRLSDQKLFGDADA